VEQSLKSLEQVVGMADLVMVDQEMVASEIVDLVMSTARTSRHFKQP